MGMVVKMSRYNGCKKMSKYKVYYRALYVDRTWDVMFFEVEASSIEEAKEKGSTQAQMTCEFGFGGVGVEEMYYFSIERAPMTDQAMLVEIKKGLEALHSSRAHVSSGDLLFLIQKISNHLKEK